LKRNVYRQQKTAGVPTPARLSILRFHLPKTVPDRFVKTRTQTRYSQISALELRPDKAEGAGETMGDQEVCRRFRLTIQHNYSIVSYRRVRMKHSRKRNPQGFESCLGRPSKPRMILLGLNTGMRRSEICQLELKDVDLKNARSPFGGLKGVENDTTACRCSKGNRYCLKSAFCERWLEERGNHPSPRVFVSQKSGKLHRSTTSSVFADIAERQGCTKDKRHVHCLKHKPWSFDG